MNATTENSPIRKVIFASSVGTLIEWYDFYIFGSLAVVISTKFFPSDNPTAAFLSTLATFAAGFVVRPFGALFFGRLGDIIGRKYTFMATLLLMGGSTFLIGCIPSYETIGFLAPLLVLILRLLQGLALGGEYGGAATYVAEHAPAGEKGILRGLGGRGVRAEAVRAVFQGLQRKAVGHFLRRTRCRFRGSTHPALFARAGGVVGAGSRTGDPQDPRPPVPPPVAGGGHCL